MCEKTLSVYERFVLDYIYEHQGAFTDEVHAALCTRWPNRRWSYDGVLQELRFAQEVFPSIIAMPGRWFTLDKNGVDSHKHLLES